MGFENNSSDDLSANCKGDHVTLSVILQVGLGTPGNTNCQEASGEGGGSDGKSRTTTIWPHTVHLTYKMTPLPTLVLKSVGIYAYKMG